MSQRNSKQLFLRRPVFAESLFLSAEKQLVILCQRISCYVNIDLLGFAANFFEGIFLRANKRSWIPVISLQKREQFQKSRSLILECRSGFHLHLFNAAYVEDIDFFILI